MRSKEKQPVSEAQEGQNYMCPPFFFFSSGKSQWRGLGKRIVSLRNERRSLWWREGGRRDWEKAQSVAIGEGRDSWIGAIQTFHYQKQLLRQEQHGTSWNVFELGFLIGAHYITCALWMLATSNLQKDTARSNALSCLLLKKKKKKYLGQALNRQAYLYPAPSINRSLVFITD